MRDLTLDDILTGNCCLGVRESMGYSENWPSLSQTVTALGLKVQKTEMQR